MALFKKTWNQLWFIQNDQVLQESHLRVETDLDAVTEVLEWFEQFTSPLLSPEFCHKCQLALVEGFTNAVRHAHHDLPKTTPIDLELQLFTKYLEMRIWDWGEPFDWQAKLDALCHEDIDPLEKTGGRGLMFMKQLTDEVSYVRLSNEQNCLLMRKQR